MILTAQEDPQGSGHSRLCVQERGGSQSSSWSFYRQVQLRVAGREKTFFQPVRDETAMDGSSGAGEGGV